MKTRIIHKIKTVYLLIPSFVIALTAMPCRVFADDYAGFDSAADAVNAAFGADFNPFN